MVIFLKVLPAIIFWALFGLVISKVPYPNTLTSANAFQLLAFFIPLFLALTFTFNLFIKFLPRSITLSFSLIILLILKTLGSLNIVLAGLTVIIVILLFSYFNPSTHSGQGRLTSRSNVPKMRNLSRRKRH